MPSPQKPVAESALIDALVRARENESRYIDAAVRCYRESLEHSMSRTRAMAMMGGGFTAVVQHSTTFDFDPTKEAVFLECTGQIAAMPKSVHQSSAR